jgi:hypothetical protein
MDMTQINLDQLASRFEPVIAAIRKDGAAFAEVFGSEVSKTQQGPRVPGSAALRWLIRSSTAAVSCCRAASSKSWTRIRRSLSSSAGLAPVQSADANSRYASLTLGFAHPGDTLLYLLLPLHHAMFGITLAEAGLLLAANRLVRIAGYGVPPFLRWAVIPVVRKL